MTDGTAKGGNNGRTTGGKFAAGNPGRPFGAKHKTTLAVEAILEGEAKKLTRKAVDMALAGDSTAMRLCLERIAPVRKGRTVTFDMPKIEKGSDIVAAMSALMDAVARGDVTPDEAVALSAIVEINRKAIETVELETRIALLEGETK